MTSKIFLFLLLVYYFQLFLYISFQMVNKLLLIGFLIDYVVVISFLYYLSFKHNDNFLFYFLKHILDTF